jgi:HlyD family secretion protein
MIGKGVAALSPEALDFAPGLLAIQESPPARLPRAVLYSVLALFGLLLLWSAIGHLEIIASASGRLVPHSYVQVVQPADGGIVKEILVREGELVQAGQVLARMDPQEAQADEKSIETQRALRSLQLRRIAAELSGRALKREPGDAPDLYGQVEEQLRARQAAYQDALGQARDTLRKAERDLEAAGAVLAKLRATNPILKSQAAAYGDLGKDGYAPRVTVEDKRRAYIENEQDLHSQEATVEGLTAAVAQAHEAASQVTSKYRSDLRDEEITAESDFRKLEQDAIKQSHKSGLLELRAPRAGIVKDLATHTLGTVVGAGTVLLSIVPEHEPLVAEVLIQNEDVGFVRAHQTVQIKLAAYPFQKYGMVAGEVLQIWPDASEDESSQKTDSRAPASPTPQGQRSAGYKALVSLQSQVLQARGQTLTLVSGMQVIAEIEEGRRTVLEYLLSPVQKTLYESGHER